jgi:hypothetical protein
MGAEPVVGISARGRAVLGWEAGGGTDGVCRANIGGSYRSVKPAQRLLPSTPSKVQSKGGTRISDYEYVHYLAYEPGLLGGATLGIAHGNLIGIKESHGLWIGAGSAMMYRETDGSYSKNPFDHGQEGHWKTNFTFTIGWRRLTGEHEFYFAPKIVYALVPRINS